jgi:hypothetical protein
LIGEAALACLSGSRTGRVFASVTRAIYLLCEDDELLWLVSETSPMHRRCLQVPPPLPRMPVDSSFFLCDGRLMTATGVVLEFGRFPVWKPQVYTGRKTIPIRQLAELVQSAYQQFTTQNEPSGWGVLIPAILQVVKGQVRLETPGDGIILPGNIWPKVDGILTACLAHDFASIMQHAAGLIGLGQGLTPSGDDFLGGLFFSISFLRSVYPEIQNSQRWNYSDFILGCRTQTNRISYALLKDHSEGHGLEPLHCFANALLEGRAIDQALPFAGEMAKVGHSTGWEVLAGFLAGMSMTFSSQLSLNKS